MHQAERSSFQEFVGDNFLKKKQSHFPETSPASPTHILPRFFPSKKNISSNIRYHKSFCSIDIAIIIMIVMKTFGKAGNQLGMRLLFLYLSCLGLSEAGNKIFHQIFNRSPTNIVKFISPPAENTAWTILALSFIFLRNSANFLSRNC